MIPETLSVVERQILINQFRILSKMEVNEESSEDYDIQIEILENGYTEKYYEIFDVNPEEIPLEICEETSQILCMFRRINNATKTLSDEEKLELRLNELQFEGFDAGTDAHYHYMKFMVEKMNLWREYKNVNLKSNCRFQLKKYRKMMEYQNYLLENDKYDFNAADLQTLIELLTNKEIVA